MTFPLLPIVSSEDEIARLSVTGKILLPFSAIKPEKHALNRYPSSVDVFVDASSSTDMIVDDLIALLNIGVKNLFVSEAQFDQVIAAGLPTSRFSVEIDSVTEKQLSSKASFVVSEKLNDDMFKELSSGGNRNIFYKGKVSPQEAVQLATLGYILVIPGAELSTSTNSENLISVGDVFISTLTTDRPDGLFTTLITSPAPANAALGVVYSSKASIKASIAEGEGVYQSRKRPDELWYKGKTSGATQKLVKLEKDCDSDTVKFVVESRPGYGFCHLLNNFTCFQDGDLTESTESFGSGFAKLDKILADRKQNAVQGLYTKRLFDDEKLLIAKMKEELDELIDAGLKQDKDEVAWEAADLLYFVMTYCVKNGVSLADVERNLDVKSLKVTRRKGDAKPQYVETQSEQVSSELYKMEIIKTSSASAEEIARALTRPVQKTADIMKLVLPIVKQVQKDGDKALIELTSKFDGVTLSEPILKSPFPQELMNISDDMKDAIDLSMRNIEKFHRAQLPKEEVLTVETAPGVFCSRFAKPIENVGLYVPGGTAVLPSTAMMLGVPAKVAGCKNIIVASPPARATGKLTPEVVYVAHKLGASAIVMAGGAQAVTAMAYGTESVLKCDKILGPGNQFVTAAKMYVQNDTQALCSIDMPAGPSEVLVIADENADPDFVASDLLSQAEHGVDSQVILIGVKLTEKKLMDFDEAVRRQAEALPRKEIVAKCLAHSFILLAESYEEAFDLSNQYAPEHLILQIDNAESYVPSHIENAGSVFVGGLSPESCGDYSSGTNHTLPTYGYARQYSGVNTGTFQKHITSQNVTKEGLVSIGKAVMTLAAVEGLEAHRNAVHVRMEKLGLL
ncbi:histidine biosynthesis trifunctional-protein [Metschnikowia bicuspidata var. bicuspidata NRRL YB-4993]|uniref:Histidine biosynthesis trifunctional protein n=1 Tax=Metschnikowia bicuspidata var. bicuspidata NRRL YB-4993 TaxID=869754 RepID=A0A1A0HHP8_9ASCO|nr:histidine biosynthesis trifunctional-protein [Metschnikowia bicuspidata var. bicuspidata NRRL YB-4993]OBA23684.1 histidine biosynthesis trifunctional-protein [Metschnikowia bicuspidata var. bicuspidata NRRL YB-4993]